jgi:hypothetical protein
MHFTQKLLKFKKMIDKFLQKMLEMDKNQCYNVK